MPDLITSIGCRYRQMNFAPGYTRSSRSANRADPRLLSQNRRLPFRARYEPVIMSTMCRIPATAASGTCGGASPRFPDSGAPSISDHTTASCAHNAGRLVSGGDASSGGASSRNRSSADPDRPMHSTTTGSATSADRAGPFKTAEARRSMLSPPAEGTRQENPNADPSANLAGGVRPLAGAALMPGPGSCEPAWAPGVQFRLHLRATRV